MAVRTNKVPGRIDITQALALAISHHHHQQRKSTTMNKSDFVEFVKRERPAYASASEPDVRIALTKYHEHPDTNCFDYFQVKLKGSCLWGKKADAMIMSEWKGETGLFLVCVRRCANGLLPFLAIQVTDFDTLELPDYYDDASLVLKRVLPETAPPPSPLPITQAEFIELAKTEKPVYTNADATKVIKIFSYWNNPGFSSLHYVNLLHVGWKCPGMYKDSPNDQNSARIVDWWQGCGKGLFIVCESDDYAEIPYLTLQVVDRDTLRLVGLYSGRKPEQEMVFKRYIPAVPATTTADDSETPQ